MKVSDGHAIIATSFRMLESANIQCVEIFIVDDSVFDQLIIAVDFL